MRYALSFAVSVSIVSHALLPATAHAESGDPIGAAVKVVNVVTAELDKAERTLITNDDVRQNELIAVSQDGLSELVLADETKLALGPGAKLTLDKFVYDPDKTGGSIVLNMTRGAFRFVTGLAKKPSYVIRTPSASITVRGTIFDVYVEDSGAVWMLLHEGGVQVCNDRGQCQQLDNPCRMVRVDGGGEVASPGNWNGLRRDEDVDFDTAFPFVATPPDIDPEPRFERASVESGQCSEPNDEIRPKKRYEPKKIKRAEPKTKKVRKAERNVEEPADEPKRKKRSEPKYEEPRKKKVVVYEDKPKKKKKDYDDDKPKKKKKYDDDAAKAAKAAIAIGVGLAIIGAASKSGGKKGGGYNNKRPGNHGNY